MQGPALLDSPERLLTGRGVKREQWAGRRKPARGTAQAVHRAVCGLWGYGSALQPYLLQAGPQILTLEWYLPFPAPPWNALGARRPEEVVSLGLQRSSVGLEFSGT